MHREASTSAIGLTPFYGIGVFADICKSPCLRTTSIAISIAALIAASCAAAKADAVRHKRAIPEMVVPDPSPAEPVKAAIRIDPNEMFAGSRFEVVIRVQIAAGHHIYALDAANRPFLPTSLTLKFPEGLESKGDWSAGEPTLTKAGERVYTDSVVFRRPCKIRPNVSAGTIAIPAELRYQVCSTEVTCGRKTMIWSRSSMRWRPSIG